MQVVTQLRLLHQIVVGLPDSSLRRCRHQSPIRPFLSGKPSTTILVCRLCCAPRFVWNPWFPARNSASRPGDGTVQVRGVYWRSTGSVTRSDGQMHSCRAVLPFLSVPCVLSCIPNMTLPPFSSLYKVPRLFHCPSIPQSTLPSAQSSIASS